MNLEVGDVLYLYIDGVTEATGLNDEFVGNALQFDNITMLCIKYKGINKEGIKMAELTLAATLDELDKVIAFVNKQLEAALCPMKIQMQIDIAVEEIYVNIAHYAYNPEIGPATIRVEVGKEPLQITITFVDSGIPYDPLKKVDPDITKSSDEREIGGLGIFMVKKSMDDIQYEYKDGRNILTLKKHL